MCSQAHGLVGPLLRALPQPVPDVLYLHVTADDGMGFLYCAMSSQKTPTCARATSATNSTRAAAGPNRCASSASGWSEAIAAGVPEPTAMTLATADASGAAVHPRRPAQGLRRGASVWYTNHRSRRVGNSRRTRSPRCSSHWVELERVVRIEGPVSQVDGAGVGRLLRTRPLDSRIGAWASPQSEVIASRAVLVANAAQMARRGTCCSHPARRTGAATVSFPTPGSSGRAASRACTTGCAIA